MTSLRLKGLGTVLRQARLDSKVTLRAVARGVEADQGLLSKYETNQVGFDLDVVDQYAAELKISPVTLLLRILSRRYPELRSYQPGKKTRGRSR